MSSRSFWIKVSDLEAPGQTSSLWARQGPPDEPGVWARVEVTEDPTVQRVTVLPEAR